MLQHLVTLVRTKIYFIMQRSREEVGGGGSSAALKGLVDKSWDNVSSNLNGQKVEGFVVVVIIVVVGGDAVRPVANLRA